MSTPARFVVLITDPSSFLFLAWWRATLRRGRYLLLVSVSKMGSFFENEPICKRHLQTHNQLPHCMIHGKYRGNEMGSFRRMACLMHPACRANALAKAKVLAKQALVS